jgi:hypothetical protein
MQKLTAAEFAALCVGARVLSADEHGQKVLLTADNTIIKLFRRKRLISSAILRPYARRFAIASARLHDLNIPACRVTALLAIPTLRRHAVVYPLVRRSANALPRAITNFC